MAETNETPGPEEAEENATYTIAEAVAAICGLDVSVFYVNENSDAPCYEGYPLAKCLADAFKENMYLNDEYYSIEFAGYTWNNPFNINNEDGARFPKVAFYRVWRENNGNMLCPQWFQELFDADFETTQSYTRLKHGEHAPHDYLQQYSFDYPNTGSQIFFEEERKAKAFFANLLKRVEQRRKEARAAAMAKEAETRPAPALTAATTATPAEVICDGLTVDAVRKALEAYPALKDLLTATAEVMARPDGGLAAKDAAAIVASLSLKLQRRGGGWGRGEGGGVGIEQGRQIKTLFEVAKDPGRVKGVKNGEGKGAAKK